MLNMFLSLSEVGLGFPLLRHRFGSSAVFAAFGVVCAAAFAFTIACVPETKGRSLEEISS